jgi:uncharacterized membrane protein
VRSPRRRVRLTERRESPARIEALTDGIFSVAMTLLVLGLGVSTHETSTQNANADLWRLLTAGGLGWKFLWFLASFAVAAWFWVEHLQVFWTIDRVDRQVVWLNTLFFVPIVLSPFTTILVAQFPHANYAAVLYVADILAASLVLDVIWWYCVRGGLVAKGETRALVRDISRRLTFVTVLLVAACGVAPFFPYYAIGAVLVTMLYIGLTVGTRLLVE